MTEHSIDLKHFMCRGQVECGNIDNMLKVTTNHAIPTKRFDVEHLSIHAYIYLPNYYKLPLRIDLCAKIDAPGLYILFGNGHINFGTLWSDNRRIDDIISPKRKIKYFHNHVNLHEFVNISLLYDFKEMQIMIDGEERYYSNNEAYMKSKELKGRNKDGFQLKIACDKHVNLILKSVSIREYDETCDIIHSQSELPPPITKNECLSSGEKLTFEKCISPLPLPIQSEIIEIDKYLKSFKVFKFKRQIEKNGNKITYIAAEHGFSYAIYLSNDRFDHSLQWYLITNGKPETWHRKADMMEVTLMRLYRISPELAERMFYSLDDCVGCYKSCLAKTEYQLLGKRKIACHGSLKFTMNSRGFEDVRIFIKAIEALIMEQKQ